MPAASRQKRKKPIEIAIVAPACRLPEDRAARVAALAAARFGDRVRLHFHPQCFLSDGHFAGDDAARAAAFIEVANDPRFSAVWFARGGYGSNRLGPKVYRALSPAASKKTYLGYSDLGFMLARLHRLGIGRAVHGPMPSDIAREGGDAAVARALDYLVDGVRDGVEPQAKGRVFAFNLTVLGAMLGTPWQPDFDDARLMIEDVDEYHYRIDRALFHALSNPRLRRVRGVYAGRFSAIPENDPPFRKEAADIVRDWCLRSGVAFLGVADIGHDSGNKIVPFGK